MHNVAIEKTPDPIPSPWEQRGDDIWYAHFMHTPDVRGKVLVDHGDGGFRWDATLSFPGMCVEMLGGHESDPDVAKGRAEDAARKIVRGISERALAALDGSLRSK